MKPAVAIALIVCGVVLICVPPISDHLIRDQILQYQLAVANSQHDMPGITLRGMDDTYRVGCFPSGLAMIGIAVAGSLRKGGPTLHG